MKNSYYYILYVLAGLGLLSIAGGWSGMFRLYTVGSSSMEPSYQVGDYLWVTNVSQLGYHKVICFEAASSISADKTERRIGRILGREGDRIELRDGMCYRNGEMVDKPEVLKFLYQTSSELFMGSAIKTELQNTDVINHPGLDQVMLYLDLTTYNRYKDELNLQMKDFRFDEMATQSAIKVELGAGWTYLNYGPVTVPEGHFFFLGDNRMNAEDSRIIGCLPNQSMVGVVLN